MDYNFTLAELADAADRELRMRTSAYPRFVGAKKMTQAKAAREIALMTEIAQRLRAAADQGKLL